VKSRVRLPGDIIFRLRLHQLDLSLSLSRLFAHTLTRSRSLSLSLSFSFSFACSRARFLSLCVLSCCLTLCRETWKAGVDILTVHSSLFHFRTHFLVWSVPMNYPYHAPMNWYLRYVIRESCFSNAVTDAFVRRSFFVLVFFDRYNSFFWGLYPHPTRLSVARSLALILSLSLSLSLARSLARLTLLSFYIIYLLVVGMGRIFRVFSLALAPSLPPPLTQCLCKCGNKLDP